MICGTVGRYHTQLRHVSQVIGMRGGVRGFATVSGLILPTGPLFIADTYVSYDPDAEQLAEITLLAAEEVRRFGLVPKVALLSHSNFGTESTLVGTQDARRAGHPAYLGAGSRGRGRDARRTAALSPFIRDEIFPNSRLKGSANLLIMPGLDAANIAFNLLKVVSGAVVLGPILLGASKPVHIVTPSVTVRGLLNMSAIAVVNAAREAAKHTMGAA